MKNQKLALVLAVAAGFLGGSLSRVLSPTPVQAQTNQAPKEIRAQSFVLVDDKGNIVGKFADDEPGLLGRTLPSPYIRLYDPSGHEIWRAGGNPMRPLALR